MQHEVPIEMVQRQLGRVLEQHAIEGSMHDRVKTLLGQLPRMDNPHDYEFSMTLRRLLEGLQAVLGMNTQQQLTECEHLFLLKAYPYLKLTEGWVKEFGGKRVDVAIVEIILHTVKLSMDGNRLPTFRECIAFFKPAFDYEHLEMNQYLMNYCKQLLFGQVGIDSEHAEVPLSAIRNFVEFFFGNIQGITMYKKVISTVDSLLSKNIYPLDSEDDLEIYRVTLKDIPKWPEGSPYPHGLDAVLVNNSGVKGSLRYCADKVIVFGRADPMCAYYDIPLPDTDQTMDLVNAVIINCSSTKIYLIDTSRMGNVCVALPRTYRNDCSLDKSYPITVGIIIRIGMLVTMTVEAIINEGAMNLVNSDAEDGDELTDNQGANYVSTLVLKHLSGPFKGNFTTFRTPKSSLEGEQPPTVLVTSRERRTDEEKLLCFPVDAGVSSSHCMFMYTGNEWFIKDTESADGTFIYLKTMADIANEMNSMPFDLFEDPKLVSVGERYIFTERVIGMGPYLFHMSKN